MVESGDGPEALLSDELVRLTAFEPEDAQAIAAWEATPGFLRAFDSRPAVPRSAEQIAKGLESMQATGNDFVFAIRPVGSDALVGYLELDGVDWQHRVGGMGLAIGPGHQSQGYGKAAARLGLSFAFRELNLHRVQATVFSGNRASLALLAALGFHQEGVYRERLERDGQRFDMFLFGILRREWEAGLGRSQSIP